MGTLLLRFSAPLQSWGVESKYERRTTERSPSKSAVIGLIASALGRKRNEPVADLAVLRYGVRIDQEGALLRDFHTVSGEDSYVTERYYLSDALFLVGLEGAEELLERVETALCCPLYPLYLGRRSCPPSGKLVLGIRKGISLEEALETEPPLAASELNEQVERLRIFVETASTSIPAYYLRDNPLSFDQTRRRFGFRGITEYTVPAAKRPFVVETVHDPLKGLEG